MWSARKGGQHMGVEVAAAMVLLHVGSEGRRAEREGSGATVNSERQQRHRSESGKARAVGIVVKGRVGGVE